MKKNLFSLEDIDKFIKESKTAVDLDPDVLIKDLPCVFFLECCDCGLHHLVIIEQRHKKIHIAFFRDDRATDCIRRVRKLKIVKSGP